MNKVIKQLEEYHYKSTKKYEEKLNDSDSEEFWDEYVYFNDEEYMKRYKENYVYSDKSIINYKTKKTINIKISFF
tara:strand:- start:973 stop:1197 length:225 start_codon:yes stop_codon:yes gene_type:complete